MVQAITGPPPAVAGRETNAAKGNLHYPVRFVLQQAWNGTKDLRLVSFAGAGLFHLDEP